VFDIQAVTSEGNVKYAEAMVANRMTVKKIRLGCTTLQDVIPCASVILVRRAPAAKRLPLVASVRIVPLGPLQKRRVVGEDPESGNHYIRVDSREMQGSSDAPLTMLTDLWAR
jgi:hypothetical protein